MSVRADPLVIGAVGGSGEADVEPDRPRAGVFMGDHVDAPEDSRPLSRFYGESASAHLAPDGRLGPAGAGGAVPRVAGGPPRGPPRAPGGDGPGMFEIIGAEALRRFGYRLPQPGQSGPHHALG